MAEEGGLAPDMRGTQNPLLTRNYRVIPPSCWKYINLAQAREAKAMGPGPTFLDDLEIQFKIDAAPVIMTYESELIFRIKVRPSTTLPNGAHTPYATEYPEVNANATTSERVAAGINPFKSIWNWDGDRSYRFQFFNGLMSGLTTMGPLYRVKLKSMSQIIKRAYCTLSNCTYQSINTPQYLNEILLRKTIEEQRKYPDNYTFEYCVYNAEKVPQGTTNTGETNERIALTDEEAVGVVFGQNRIPAPEPVGYEQQFIPIVSAVSGVPPMLLPGNISNYNITLANRSSIWNNWDNTALSTPYYDAVNDEIVIDFRIPLTELLPVFKIGVIPTMMINSSTIDLALSIYHPKRWFVSNYFNFPYACECWLNITTVSYPDINPLAEMLLKPHIMGDRFIAPYLDYFTLENTYDIMKGTKQDFYFNIQQFFRNVPFISLSFLDVSSTGKNYNLHSKFPGEKTIISSTGLETARDNQLIPKYDGAIGLDYSNRVVGGFYTLPPDTIVSDLKILVGESAHPLTQLPIDSNSMYLYNRKHFEMYGRTFNYTRVCPISREKFGEASYFFDLSHGPMSGFNIAPNSPLQIQGTFYRHSAYIAQAEQNQYVRIKILLTIWYSNNFNVLLQPGAVLSLQ